MNYWPQVIVAAQIRLCFHWNKWLFQENLKPSGVPAQARSVSLRNNGQPLQPLALPSTPRSRINLGTGLRASSPSSLTEAHPDMAVLIPALTLARISSPGGKKQGWRQFLPWSNLWAAVLLVLQLLASLLLPSQGLVLLGCCIRSSVSVSHPTFPLQPEHALTACLAVLLHAAPSLHWKQSSSAYFIRLIQKNAISIVAGS